MNVFHLSRRDGDDRFIFLRLLRAGEHLEIPLAHGDLAFHHHLLVLLIEPNVMLFGEIDDGLVARFRRGLQLGRLVGRSGRFGNWRSGGGFFAAHGRNGRERSPKHSGHERHQPDTIEHKRLSDRDPIVESSWGDFALALLLLRYPVRGFEYRCTCLMDGGMKVEDYRPTVASALVDAACDLGDSWPSAARETWSNSAPGVVRASFAEGDFAAGWKTWKRHLLSRRRPLAIARLVNAPETMLDWGLASPRKSARRARLSMLLGSQPTKRASDRKSLAAAAREWLEGIGLGGDSRGLTRSAYHGVSNGHSHIANRSNGGASVLTAESQAAALVESLTWLHLLAARVELFDGELWWRVYRELKRTTLLPTRAIEYDPLGHQLAAGELPLTLAYLFPELAGGEELRKSAAAVLSQGMAELFDGEALPQCRHLHLFPAIVACWTRCRLLGEHLGRNCWTPEGEPQFPL